MSGMPRILPDQTSNKWSLYATICANLSLPPDLGHRQRTRQLADRPDWSAAYAEVPIISVEWKL